MIGTLIARVEHMADWCAYISDPERGELGYCLGHGGDDVDLETGERIGDPWSPELATAVPAGAGWTVVGAWRETNPDAEHQYEANVRRA